MTTPKKSKFSLVLSLLGWMFLTPTSEIQAQKDPISYTQASQIKLSDDTFKSSDCIFIDNSSQKDAELIVTEFESRPLFVYTHPKLRRWMTDKFLMEASARLYRANDNVFLRLQIRINSENARGSYGDLEQGQKIKLIFNNGEHLYLENIERDKGKVNKAEKLTLYEGIYPLSKQNIKDLKKRDVYRLGIIWEEGYEEYEIHNIDLIKNQLSCLE
jgi:hypothetical protein